MGPGNALPQYSFTPPRPPDPSNFGLYGGCYSRSDCYRLQGTHHFRRELTQFSSQPSYPPWPPSQTTIHGYVFPHQFPHLSAHLSANARPPPLASSAHHYHFQSYHFQQPTPPGHYPPSPPIDPNPQNTPYHFQHQPPVIIGHPTAPLSPLLPYHVASVYPNPQHESLNPPVNYPHSDSSISHHQTQSKANIISQSTLSFTYGNVFGGDRDGTPTTKRFKLIRVNQNLRVRSQILMKRKPLSKLARRSRTQIHGDSKTDRCGALLITSAEPNAFDVPVETSPASVPVMIVAAVIESTPKHLGQKTHMGNHVDMLDLNSQLQRLVKICIVKDARKVFDKRPKRDAVSWTSMISGYVRVSDSSKALALFSNMWVQPQVFNRVSSVCGTMHSTCYSPSLCGKRREYHALYMFDKMLPSDRMYNAGRTIIAPRSIRDKGGGLTNHREIFYASDYFGLPNARSQIHYTIRLTAVSEMAICFVSAKQDNGGFIEDKELEQSLSGHTSGIDSVSFDSSEVLVAIGAASGTIKLWDLEEAKIVCTLIDHRSNCISVDFHPFGEFFASHSLDTNLKIWDIRKKGCIHTYKGHTRGVNAIRFTPDGLWVVSGGEDNTVKLWDLTDGKLLHDFKCNEGQIQCIGFHPHEFQLATGSADGTVNFWDLDTFELIGSAGPETAGPETAGVRSLIFSLDGRALLCGLHESLKVFSWEPIRCHDAVDVGLVTLQLPDHDVTFNSAEDAQNRVATYTLCQLFPDLPIHLVITAPYAALVVQWKEGETITNVEDSVKDRRATFVDSLLKANGSTSTFAANVVYDSDSLPNVVLQLQVQEPRNAELNPHKDAESSYLRQELENKHKKQKFKEMLKARAALPIAGLKGDILQLLHDNNVLIVCGETGSGKTTQVPQFILDDMIQSGRGGHCNIICTQPWRIAAISVADRVADERCEPSPGSNGSLVGYQVRLDNASNEKTKLLFCTTGILLRKFVGDRNLSGITHVIVHEVHEWSLLGDFLLIVLKNLIEKQSALNTPKLKVILISATVDSNLFSNYFGGCPVITAEGKFHKLSQRYYGPVQVVERVGKVAYKMQLPVTAKIHDVFHVSLLKKKLGDLISAQPQLPHIIDPENPRGEPFAVLDRRVLKKRGAVINQWLVQWLGTTPDKATWEDVETILLSYPSFDLDMEIPTGPAPIEIDFLACLNLGSSSV